jgi:superfamily II helicase
MYSAKIFARTLLLLARLCAQDPDQVDPRLLSKLQEYGYIDQQGKLTPFGKKIVNHIITYRKNLLGNP